MEAAATAAATVVRSLWLETKHESPNPIHPGRRLGLLFEHRCRGSPDDAYLTGEYRLDGYWLLSGKWMGDMGIALKIDKNRFSYWFYSDVKSDHEPTYPLSGEVEIKKNTVHLEYEGPEHLYSDQWHLVIYKNQICLWRTATIKTT